MNDLHKKLQSKEYRDAFVSAHIQDGVAFQIRALREQRGWNQGTLAGALKVSQPAVAQYESGERTLNLGTLERLASAFDVALVVRFVRFSELARWVSGLTTGSLEVSDFKNDEGFMELKDTSALGVSSQLPKIERTNAAGAARYESRGHSEKIVQFSRLMEPHHV